MKQKILFSMMFVLMVLPALTKAQSPVTPVIYKDWTFQGESPIQIEMEYRIIKCANTPQIHFFIFNENPVDKSIVITVEITNVEDNRKTIKEVSFQAEKAGMYRALCDSDPKLDTLKIDVPDGYNPATISVKITLKA